MDVDELFLGYCGSGSYPKGSFHSSLSSSSLLHLLVNYLHEFVVTSCSIKKGNSR